MIKNVIKMINNILLLLLFCLLFSSASYAQGFLHVEGTSIVDSAGNNVLLRGFGLGGWMVQEGYMLQIGGDAQHQIKEKITDLIGEEDTEVFYDAWRANHCRKVDIDSLAAWGFNSVRLPMHYNLFTLPIEEEPANGANTKLQTGFTMIDSLLKWCAANKMYLILDLHAAPGGQGYDSAISDYDPDKPSLWESAENRQKTIWLWQQIALRYADEPWIGGYDLINETNWNLPGNGLLKELYLTLTSVIRQVDPNHIIFIEGNWFANDFTGLTPPWDDNMVYSFHKYWSTNDLASIQWMLNIRLQHNRPIWCGESGENSNVWYTDALRLMEANNIGWAWWTMKRVEAIQPALSIEKTADYQTLLDYWSNPTTQKPSANFARNTLMDLTEKIKLENCEFNNDVVDAMIRQVATFETIPFADNSLPGKINAVDYDLGTNRYAYYDNQTANYSVSTGNYTSWNDGWSYRNDGVDIQPSEDLLGFPYMVAFTEDGEWLKYSINVTEADSYAVTLRIASQDDGKVVRIVLDNSDITDPITINSTGGSKTWQSLAIATTFITAGPHELKMRIVRGGFNINQLEFVGQNSGSGISVKTVELFQNYPNPFNPGTTISFRLAKDSFTNLTLYNAAGQKVRTIINEFREAGFHTIEFHSKQLASGVYFYKISAAKSSQTKKLVVVR
jgi:hypothetical protein